jgi:sugar/nucleoside kinase (ribokinase family)
VKTPHGQVVDELGGSATYFSLAASRTSQVGVVAVTGTDFPAEHRALLQRHAVDLDGLRRREGKTFRWAGVYGADPNDRTTLDTQLNVFADFRPDLPARYRGVSHLFLGNIHPRLQAEVLDQVEQPRIIACDTMNFWIEGERDALDEVLPRIDLLIVNDEEVRMLSGEANAIVGARSILRKGPRAIVVKKGEHGAMLISEQGIFAAPALPVERVVDPTGAGDSFAGAFMARLTQEPIIDDDAMRRAVVYGTVAASFCVERFGVAGLCETDEKAIVERRQSYRELTRVDYTA